MAQDDIFDTKAVRVQAKACQKIIDDCIEGKIQVAAVVELLQRAGANYEEAADYLKQLSDRTAARNRGNESEQSCKLTPEGLTPEEADEFQQRRHALEEQHRIQDEEQRKRAADSAAWALLRTKASMLQSFPGSSSDPAQQLALLLGLDTSPTASSLPASVLAAAPHLGKLTSSAGDAHLDSTWKLHQAYSGDKAIDAIVDIMQRQQLEEPIPRSIWKEIVQDRFVNFQKLFAAMEPGYDHHDEPKDFHGGFALVKRDQAVAQKPVVTEADWSQVFGAWAVSVSLVYPHHEEELQGYRRIVMELFGAVLHDPSIVINFDIDVQACYAKEPFRMDDCNQINVPLFAQMFNTAHAPAKRPGSFALSVNNAKHAAVPCINWNYG